jgi:hypothetical protein
VVGYRFYLLTEHDTIQVARNADSGSDADALLLAQGLFAETEGFPEIEIWQGKRLVGRVPQPVGNGLILREL